MTGKIIIFISIGVLLCCAVGGIFLWWPKVQGYFSLEQQLFSMDSRLQEKLEYFSKLQEEWQKLNDYKDSISKIDSAFPSDPNISVPPLIVYMLKVTADSGISVDNLNIGTSVKPGSGNGLSKISFELSGSAASYADFKNLVNNIYNNARMIDTDLISLSAPSQTSQAAETGPGKATAGQSQNENKYQFSMTLRTNFYLEQNNAQNPGNPNNPLKQ